MIFGAGGFAIEIADQFEGLHESNFYVEEGREHHRMIATCQLVRSPDQITEYDAVLGVGSPALRLRFYELGKKFDMVFEIRMHDTAQVSEHSQIDDGVTIAPFCCVSPGVTLKRGVLLNYGVTVGHDSIIGDFSNLAPGVHISGNCTIGQLVYIGSGAVLREGVTICDGATVGAGAVVLENVPAGETWVGVPAKRLGSR